MKIPVWPRWLLSGFVACGVGSAVHADLIGYWPFEESDGMTAANAVAGGTAAEIDGSPLWTVDDLRGNVLEFDGATYADAGLLPEFDDVNDFTWSFWANSLQTPNNNVIIGNRYPDEGWSKFTTNSFEFRDLPAAYNATIDYADFATDTWVHHVVIKQGSLFTYYRNGLMQGRSVLGVLPNGIIDPMPLYFGGDQFQENWAGRLDDVAVWDSALPLSSVIALARDAATPVTASPEPAPAPPLTTVLADDFSGTLEAWTVSNRGLESTAPTTYNPPAIQDGALVLGGVTEAQYWLGSSVESTQLFDSRLYTEVSVKRVLLEGGGTAYRSSVWIFGDDTHFLHFSHNVGETGWQYNANDAGGVGTLLPTGGGNNLPAFDLLDGDPGEHEITIRVIPLGDNRVNMEMLVDGESGGVHGFSNFPPNFRVILTGQARAAGDEVTAVFDDVLVRRETVENLPPSFSPNRVTSSAVIENDMLIYPASHWASDPEGGPLTLSKVSGPDWVTVSEETGQVLGTAPAGSAGFYTVVVRATDNAGATADLTLAFRVQPASLPEPPLFGWWPLNEGDGELVNDVSGQGRHGTIQNWETGGLDETGLAWTTDPQYGTVLSFNGDDGTGSWVVVGDPFEGGPLPEFFLEDNFAWSFWAKPNQAATTEILLGNRYDANNVDFAPREFIKFTGLSFEWHHDGIGENVEYPPVPSGAWHHHVAVKEGETLYYYRDAVFVNANTITAAPLNGQPLYFAGQGVENWAGWMADVRLFTGTLSEATIGALFATGPSGPAPSGPEFRLSSFSRAADGALTITWPSEAGQTFVVEWSTTLANQQWSAVGAPLTATGVTTSFTLPAGGTPDPAAAPAGYLRVVRQP